MRICSCDDLVVEGADLSIKNNNDNNFITKYGFLLSNLKCQYTYYYRKYLF